MSLTPEERTAITRQYLLETDLDGETRSKIHCIAFVLEYDARESGDPDAGDVYITTCWTLSRPENLASIDEIYANAQPVAFDILCELEEGGSW